MIGNIDGLQTFSRLYAGLQCLIDFIGAAPMSKTLTNMQFAA